jgi:hypothetical protein
VASDWARSLPVRATLQSPIAPITHRSRAHRSRAHPLNRCGIECSLAGVEELRAHYGWRAVRAGLSALLAPDAQWLMAHASADRLPRGVSSYRFCRLPPLRAALMGETSGSARQYAVQLAADAPSRWLSEFDTRRATELRDESVLGEWEVVRAVAGALDCVQSARHKLAQVGARDATITAPHHAHRHAYTRLRPRTPGLTPLLARRPTLS